MSNYNNGNNNNNGEEYSQYLNLKGLQNGNLFEVKEMPNSNPKAYIAVISVPNGKGENVEHVDFQAVIADTTAMSLLLEHREAINAEGAFAKIYFGTYGLRFRPYVIQTGKRKGTAAVSVNTHLSYIGKLTIGDDVLYHNSKQDDAKGESDDFSDANAESLASKAAS